MLFALSLLFATWTDVATALGRAGTEMPGGVYKVAFPRSDLDVVAGGVHVKPALALGSWAAFIRTGHGAMAMGDLVLTESEVNDVISALQAGGPPAAGVATAINFQPTGAGRAATTGDFVLLGNEVNAVIRALRTGGIAVTAIHSHMLDEEPRLFFLHFWGEDDAAKLARTLRNALDVLH